MSVANSLFFVRSDHRLRAGVELDSRFVGKLSAGARVSVLERRVLADGTARARLGKPPARASQAGMLPRHGSAPRHLVQLGVTFGGAGLSYNLGHVLRMHSDEDQRSLNASKAGGRGGAARTWRPRKSVVPGIAVAVSMEEHEANDDEELW